MNAFKFLRRGAISPFTEFPWPPAGEWVAAPARRDDAWIHACRPGDLPHWLDDELWRIELDEPVRQARYQVAAPRARLLARVGAWDAARWEYAAACALRARDLALPHLPPAVRAALEGVDDLAVVAAAAGRAGSSVAAALVADAARNAREVGPATASYIAAILAATIGGGLSAFEAERGWQAAWLAERLELDAAGAGRGA